MEIDRDLSILITVIAGIFAILGGVYGALRWGRKLFIRILNIFTMHKSLIPKETIRIVPLFYANYWRITTRYNINSEKIKGIEISLHCFITNIYEENVSLVNVSIIFPRKMRSHGHINVRDIDSSDYKENKIIIPKETVEALIHFWISPAISMQEKDVKVTFIIIDNFGNEYKLRNILIRAKDN